MRYGGSNAALIAPGAALSCSLFIVPAFALCSLSLCSLLEPPSVQFSSVQLLSRVQLFAIPWTAARQASLSITNSWSLLKLMPVEAVMPSSHLILCRPLLLLPLIFPSIRVFSSESTLLMRWPKYWSFNMTQQSHCWTFTPRKPELKETHVFQCLLKHCLQ